MEAPSSKRIAFFLPNLMGGGAERIYVNLANHLAATQSVDMVLIHAEGVYLSQLSPQVRIYELGCKSEYQAFLPLFRYIRQVQPDVLLSTLDLSSMVAILLRMVTGNRIKLIVSLVNTVSMTERFPRWKKQLERPLLKWLFPKADHLVALSTGVAEDYAAYANMRRERITVIYNPVDLDAIQTRRQELPDHPWFQSHELPIILSVGRLTAQKNYPLLLQAFHDLQADIPSRLVILGEGEDRVQLNDQVQKLGLQDRVSLPGFVQNPFAYMGHTDCFVLSSNYEGLACVLLEAMACGCPVVSTNYQSGASEVLREGQYGHLVPMNDPMALKAAMADVLLGHGRLVPQSWLEQFGVGFIAEQYRRLIED